MKQVISIIIVALALAATFQSASARVKKNKQVSTADTIAVVATPVDTITTITISNDTMTDSPRQPMACQRDTLAVLNDSIAKLHDRIIGLERQAGDYGELMKENTANRKGYLDGFFNSVYIMLRSPFNPTIYDAVVNSINKNHSWMLHDVQFKNLYELLLTYPEMNKTLVEYLTALNKDPFESESKKLVKNYGIPNYEQVSRIPFLKMVIDETKDRINHFDFTVNYSDLIYMLTMYQPTTRK